MGRRKLLSNRERQALFAIPTDEESLIRHYTLSMADLFEIQLRRRPYNQIGFAISFRAIRSAKPLRRPLRRVRYSIFPPISQV